MRIRYGSLGIAATITAGLAFAPPVIAQEPPPAEPAEDSGPVEEIVVVAPRPGSRRDVPREFEDPLRARLLRDLYRAREDQAELARMAAEAEKNEGPVRFGYDPMQDQPTLEDDMQLPQRETTRPATIFTIEF
jgi:hypothetical protein